jgi:hypothetical protein
VSKPRIYVIVAETVQNPLITEEFVPHHFRLTTTPDTKTIVQPVGRIGAQIGHVVSEMRMAAMLTLVEKTLKKSETIEMRAGLSLFGALEKKTLPLTTIVFSVPDSFQLEFRKRLLRKSRIQVYSFYDENPEYGEGAVETAICTPPIMPERAYEPLAYLKLWGTR